MKVLTNERKARNSVCMLMQLTKQDCSHQTALVYIEN